jgi:hypothetical protein
MCVLDVQSGVSVKIRTYYLNITPFFPSVRSYFVDLNSVNRVEYPTYKQPSREPVKKMIEFGMSASLYPYLFIRTSYSIFSLSKCGTVHESGSWACWLGIQSCCSCKGKDPNNLRNRDVIVTLDDVRVMTFGVKLNPPRVWSFWMIVTERSWSSLPQNWKESRVPFLRIVFAIVMSTWTWCVDSADRNCSWEDKVIFTLIYYVWVFMVFCISWKWMKPSVKGSSFSTFKGGDS